jgi:hypothetical protein
MTEIMYNPRAVPGLATNLTLEFIEFYNSKPWDEDMGGFFIDGVVHYVFPSNMVLRAGAYVVVARVPALIESTYGITGVLGPWDGATTNRLPTDLGTIRLRHRQGAVLLQTDYRDSPPWPEAADGTGHSLVLARPSLGENDPRAWCESDQVGGSPGRADPVPQEPLASIFINEWQNHSDPEDWMELYNHSNVPVDLSGAWLSDDPLTNKFRIPNGTIIAPRGFVSFLQTQLGFELFAGGETILLWNSNQTRVLDIIDFRGASNNISSGRWPDGGPFIYNLTPPAGVPSGRPNNLPNTLPIRYSLVITEIMFNPISGNTDDEYIEIYNRSGSSLNISGWSFLVGINYVFPTNFITTAMPAGAYWVVAKNPTNLFAIYANLTTNNTFGPYGGTLANGGERILLTGADYDTVIRNGQPTVVKLDVPICDLTYGDGGKWGNWIDGQGSSLELIDLEADPHHSSNWADSSDTRETAWTAIESTVPVGETLGPVVNDRLIVMLQGVGECLLDEVEIRVNNGPNLLPNGGFESGLDGWLLQGSHDFSTIDTEGFAGTKSLHLRAGSRGDNQSNRILSPPLNGSIPPGSLVSFRAKAKWLHGFPEILLRLHGSATEAFGRMSLPRRIGSPGLQNSRRIANAGPAIYQVSHAPLLPAAGAPVVITARATDPQGVPTIRVRYRLDPETNFVSVPMVDDGTGSDAIAHDGIYSAAMPGQPAGQIVAFYVEAVDGLGAVGTFPNDLFPQPGFDRCWPNDAVARECVVRWGEPQLAGDFPTYHLWLTSANSNRWHVRDAQNNTPMDGTFIYNNTRAIYNALPLYSGSPWHRTNAITGPAGTNRVDYEMNFPDDDALLGSTDFVLNNPGNPDITTISDLSAVAEATVYKIFEGMGLPFNHRRYIHFFVNGSQRSKAYERPGNFIFEDSQQPNGDMTAQWFPDEPGGQLFKVEDWFEFQTNGFDIGDYNDADLARRPVLLNGQSTLLPAPYRFMFRKRSVSIGSSANDYSPIFALVDAVSPADNPTNSVIDSEIFATVADYEAWMRHFAIQRTVGNFDSYGWERGKNDYLYSGTNGFSHMPWDIDYGLGLGRPPNAPLFASNDPRIVAMFNTPLIVRAYWRAFDELVNRAFTHAALDPHIDARVIALLANNVNIDLNAVDSIKDYITARRAFLLSQLATVDVPFTTLGPLNLTTNDNLLFITGTAPVRVKDILLNGVLYPVTWTTATNFQTRVVLGGGLNTLNFAGRDRLGNVLPEVGFTVTAEYTGPVPDPVGALVVSEILYAPPIQGAQFVEIMNLSTNNFDLAGWRLDGVNTVFPAGSILTNRQIAVLALNRAIFRNTYGRIPVLTTLGSAPASQDGTLVLVGTNAAGEFLVNGVHYEAVAPFPPTTPGQSLQVIDPAQDNSRPSNWAVSSAVPSTPGAPNSVAGTLPPYDPIWLNELQYYTLAGPLDNVGEHSPWIELYNSGPAALNLSGYYLADNYSSNLATWAFPPGTIIGSHEYKLLWADGQPEQGTATDLHSGFALNQSGQLALVRLVGGQPQITDYLTWRSLGVNLSYGSFPDGQAIDRLVLHNATAGTTNFEQELRVYVNEWMARNSTTLSNAASGNFDDWIELYNAESFPVDLGGYWLTDNGANAMKFHVPSNGQYRIPPRGFLLVWADNQPGLNTPNRPELHVNFQLNGSAGDIGLFRPDGVTKVDLITYAAQTNDVSEGRYADGANLRYFMTKATPRGPNLVPLYNSAPVFPFIPDQFVEPGRTVTVTVRATDPEGTTLHYEIVSSATNSFISQSGVYIWVISPLQPEGDYPVTVQATDSGVPPRSTAATFVMSVRTNGVVVLPATPPVFDQIFSVGGQVSFTIETVPTRTYRISYTDDLSSGVWTRLDRDFVAAGPQASLTDPLATPQRFYRAQRMD